MTSRRRSADYTVTFKAKRVENFLFCFQLLYSWKTRKEAYCLRFDLPWPAVKQIRYGTKSKERLLRFCSCVRLYLFGGFCTRQWEGISFNSLELSKSSVSHGYFTLTLLITTRRPRPHVLRTDLLQLKQSVSLLLAFFTSCIF